ncbi:MAG: ankyrin repeat domain-containing protein [Fimbriimonadaceae bacterium]|nr:ankyrin repeat domain-containing protein [Fimbriimonadaceae bacterium]
MSQSLPDRPNLEHLKSQAKDLLKAFYRGDADAIERLGPLSAEPKLHDAQFALARDYGFKSWDALRAQVTRINLGQDDSFEAACALGRVEEVARRLGEDATLVNRVGKDGKAPLVVTCFSPLLRVDETRSALVQTARVLLDAGADPNAYWIDPNGDYKAACLYGATGVNNVPELARMLLEAGASPDDGESLYHSTEHRDHECLKLLMEFGVEEISNSMLRMLDFEDLVGLKLMLDYGCDPNATQPNALHHAILRGRSRTIAQMLLDYGVDALSDDPMRGTPYAFAVRQGLTEVADLLRERGFETPTTVIDRAVGAFAHGEPELGERLLREHAVLGAEIRANSANILDPLAERGEARALRALLAAGLDPSQFDQFKRTPLHSACWYGHAAAAKALVEGGADMTLQDGHYGGTPLGWACHGSEFCSREGGNYPATVTVLLEAGSPLPDNYSGSAEVNEILDAFRKARAQA